MPQHGDVQALLVGKVLYFPFLVVYEGAGVGQPELLCVSLSSANEMLVEQGTAFLPHGTTSYLDSYFVSSIRYSTYLHQ